VRFSFFLIHRTGKSVVNLAVMQRRGAAAGNVKGAGQRVSSASRTRDLNTVQPH